MATEQKFKIVQKKIAEKVTDEDGFVHTVFKTKEVKVPVKAEKPKQKAETPKFEKETPAEFKARKAAEEKAKATRLAKYGGKKETPDEYRARKEREEAEREQRHKEYLEREAKRQERARQNDAWEEAVDICIDKCDVRAILNHLDREVEQMFRQTVTEKTKDGKSARYYAYRLPIIALERLLWDLFRVNVNEKTVEVDGFTWPVTTVIRSKAFEQRFEKCLIEELQHLASKYQDLEQWNLRIGRRRNYQSGKFELTVHLQFRDKVAFEGAPLQEAAFCGLNDLNKQQAAEEWPELGGAKEALKEKA